LMGQERAWESRKKAGEGAENGVGVTKQRSALALGPKKKTGKTLRRGKGWGADGPQGLNTIENFTEKEGRRGILSSSKT